MEIGVIGVNEFAKAFCRHWISRGHKILFADLQLSSNGYSFAEELGTAATLALPHNVAKMAEVIVLAIAHSELSTTVQLMGEVKQKIIIDLITEDGNKSSISNKTSFDDLQGLLPEAKIVKITPDYPIHLRPSSKANGKTVYTYANDHLAQRLVHWFTDGAGFKVVSLLNDKSLN